jgi:competence protein ComEC
MRGVLVTAVCVLVAVAGSLAQTRPGTLDIYYIDTEGGQSTLFVGPTGESLLVDTGNAGERDLGRIRETLRAAGVTAIDHMWSTHYHGDHVGSLLALAEQVPIRHI